MSTFRTAQELAAFIILGAAAIAVFGLDWYRGWQRRRRRDLVIDRLLMLRIEHRDDLKKFWSIAHSLTLETLLGTADLPVQERYVVLRLASIAARMVDTSPLVQLDLERYDRQLAAIESEIIGAEAPATVRA